MTNEELDAIEARAKAATEGPWAVKDCDSGVETRAAVRPGRTFGYGCDQHVIAHLYDGEYIQYEDPKEQAANCAFIASARSDVPALVAEVRLLREENDRLRARALEASQSFHGIREAYATVDDKLASADRALRSIYESNGFPLPEES